MANEQFNKVKDYIVYKVVNHDSNIKLLAGVPHVNYLDLAIIFYRMMPETVDLDEKEVVLIGNEELFLWDVTVEDLMNAAGTNTSRILGVKIRGILSTIAEYMDDISMLEIAEEEEKYVPLYVVSNKYSYNGASVILYKDLLKAIAAKLKSDIYIIPSSIHEVIVVKSIKDCEIDTAGLKELIAHINDTSLPESEVLSNSLYFYSRDTNVLSFA
ncbi:DUF5688 family protein [Pseudobutyrivibrio ruminis]|uniref:DUF5688 family protein n=1 Tax=Pseudobutyrivibrio ruminis TaxID=46206 RepID=UPI0004072FEA|nr:DUF5688 family protein [Pseudobutyrivibrio ruminis]